MYSDNGIFENAYQFVAKWEWSNDPSGRYTNDPDDPGGETKFGISKRAHPELDIKSLTEPVAKSIYLQSYWTAMGCQTQPPALAICLFDTAVNNGARWALKWLADCEGEYTNYIADRRDFYIRLVQNDQNNQKFLNGWLNRISDLRKLCDIIAIGNP